MTLVAVVSDTHISRGSRRLSDACLRVLAKADVILHGGDVTGASFLVELRGPRAGRAGRLAAAFAGCDAVVYGHTHAPETSRHGDLWILNPGSPTERRRSPARSMLVLDVGTAGIRPRLVELG